jgi:hypothetical protein
MEFRVLGPMEVRGSNTPLPLDHAKQRALLPVMFRTAEWSG